MITLVALASAAQQPQIPALGWDWSANQRLYVETEVRLPELMWVNAEKNRSARVIGFQIRAVLDCVATDKSTARKQQVECRFEDIGLVAGGVAGDQGMIVHILEEYDALFDEAVLQLMVRDDGRIVDVNLDQVPVRNLRTRSRKESMRLLTRFLAAGMEVPVSRREGDALWVSNESLLCTLPTTLGTAGGAEIVHQASMSDGLVEIATNGRGTMSPGESLNTFTCELAAHTMMQPGAGPTERTWTMRGEPTPGSPIALGAAGYEYLQRGSLRRLTPEESVDVGETREVIPNTSGPSAIQQWNTPTTDPMDPAGR
ncbi:MAG: hypothetical protein R3F61_16605 [Myxococcota bacterium]